MERRFAYIALALVGCGGSGTVATVDASMGATPTLSLAVTAVAPAFDQLVLTGGEIELEHLGLFGDSDHDQRTEIPRITFQLGPTAQDVTYDMAAPGLYSRLETTIDHIALTGTWRGNPLSIDTKGDERTVDIACTPEELSSTSSAAFALLVAGSQWVDATFLDGLVSNGMIDVNEGTNPELVDEVMARVVPSFSVTTP